MKTYDDKESAAVDMWRYGDCLLQEAAVNGDHIWTDTSASTHFCYVGESSCLV